MWHQLGFDFFFLQLESLQTLTLFICSFINFMNIFFLKKEKHTINKKKKYYYSN